VARSTVDALTFRAVTRSVLFNHTWQSSTKAMLLVSSEPPYEVAVRLRRLSARDRRQHEGCKTRIGQRGHDEFGTSKWVEGGDHVGHPTRSAVAIRP
jgi:hypothetical protein